MAEVVIRFKGDTTHLMRSIKGIDRALKGIETSGTKVNNSLKGVSRSLDGIKGSGDRAAGALKAMVGALAGASLFNFVDGLQQMQNKLRMTISDTGDFNFAMTEVDRIANKMGISMVATGDLFAAVGRNAEKLGYDISQTSAVTESMATALYASGTGAQQAASVMTQFSQILAKGKVNGDEFTTIMENLGGPVLDTIAKNMGLTTAQLVELKEKGLIDAKSFTDALIRSLGELQTMTGNAMPTLSQSLQRVQNAFGAFLINLEKATGIFAKVGAGLEWMSKNMRIVIALAAGMIGAFAIGRLVAIVQQIVLLTKAIRTMGITAGIASALATGGIAALTGLAAAAATAAGAYMLFPELDLEETIAIPMGDAADNTNNAASAAGDLASNLGPIPTQIQGIADKFKEITADLDEQIRLSKLTANERKIESEILRINQQLSGMMLEDQKNIVRSKLEEVQANERNVTLLQEQASAIEAMFDTSSSFDKALKARRELELLAEGNTIEEIKRMREAMYNDPVFVQSALDNANNNVRLAINAEIGKHNELIGLREDYNARVSELQRLQMDYELGIGNVTTEQYELILDARAQLEAEYNQERIEATQAMQDRMLDLERRRIESELALNKSGLAQKLSLQQQETLQRIGANERQQQIVRDRVAFEKKSETEKAAWAISQGAEVFNQLGTYNKQAFEAAKAFNIAQAIMNTYTGATKALATYPPPFNFIAAAAVVAGGLAQVAQIRSQSYSGRQLGGPVMNGTSYLVGENGPEMFTPTTNGSITRNGNLNTGEAVNVNFNITANDASGFDDLLLQRRGMITQMVSDAIQDRGQRSML